MNELCDYIKLQQSGKPYPRSCPECQLGPCKHPIKSLDAQPVKLPAMPMEIQEWCWHLDTAMEQDARHQAMALGSAWPVISKWLRSVVGHAKQSVKAFDAQPVPVINERQEWLHTPECLVGDECSCFTVTPKQPVPVEPDYLIRLRNALKGFKSDGAFAGDKDIVDYIDSLQSALKLAQEHCDRLTGMKFSDRVHAALVSRAEKAESLAEQFRKDAERYRWISANAAVVTGANFNWRSEYGHPMVDSTLDAAIDSARAE